MGLLAGEDLAQLFTVVPGARFVDCSSRSKVRPSRSLVELNAFIWIEVTACASGTAVRISRQQRSARLGTGVPCE
jgi:hypothetical protein